MNLEEMKRKITEMQAKDLGQQQNDQECYQQLQATIDLFKYKRPGDKSEKDRIYSIAITELQKTVGFFWLYSQALIPGEEKGFLS